jgi:hypothetical protein
VSLNSHTYQPVVCASTFGIAGVNTRSLYAATLGIAGDWGGGLRPHVVAVTASPAAPSSTRLGDRAARSCWSRACYLLDYTYLTCPSRVTGALPPGVPHHVRSGDQEIAAIERWDTRSA